MTKGEFNAYCALLLMGFSGHLTEENEQQHIAATSEEGLRKRKAFLKQFVPVAFHNQIDQIIWYENNTADLMKRVHANFVEQAIAEGQAVPVEVIKEYPELEEKLRLGATQKEKEPLIKGKIIEIIQTNFDRIDLQTNRNFSHMEQEFARLFSENGIKDIEIKDEPENSAVIFKDKQTGLEYVTPVRFVLLSRKYLDAFVLTKRNSEQPGRANIPVWQVREAAVIHRHKQGEFENIITIRKGRAEIAD